VEALVRTGHKRFKTYYWNGNTFTRDKTEAVHYAQHQALGVARKLVMRVSSRVYAIRVDRIQSHMTGNPKKPSPIDRKKFPDKMRFNWGYFDGVSARERGKYPSWAKSTIYRQKHPFDKAYGDGFWKGYYNE